MTVMVLSRPWYKRVPFVSTTPPPLPDPSKTNDDSPGYSSKSPEQSSSWFSYITFSWMNDIIHLGYTRPLETSDLYNLDATRSAHAYASKIVESFERRKIEAAEYNSQLDDGKIGPSIWKRVAWSVKGDRAGKEKSWRAKEGRKEPSLVLACNDAVFSWFWLGGLFRLLSDVGTITSPLLVKAITRFASTSHQNRDDGLPAPPIGKGIGLAIGLLLLQLVILVLNAQAYYRGFTTGLILRGALIHAIFERSLRLSSQAKSKAGLTTGKLTSMISTDISRIDFSMAYFHQAFTAPIQMIICLIILVVNLGWSALPGFAFFVIMTPLQGKITKKLFLLRKRSMVWTDRRISLLHEIFGNMSIIKMFAWEIPFSNKVSEYRNEEMRHLRNRLMVRSINNSMAFALPTMAAVLSFITYALSGHTLDAAIIFSSLSLFSLLRTPLTLFPVALNSMADGSNAINRVREVFLAETVVPLPVQEDLPVAVRIVGATFCWDSPPPAQAAKAAKRPALAGTKSFFKSVNDKLSAISSNPNLVNKEKSLNMLNDSLVEKDVAANEPFSLKNVTLDIPKGKICAIVGPVGSGKSSLVQGLIGEMRRVSGEMSFVDEISYCPQVAWIRNATIRDNITFGLPFEEKRYREAIEAACLKPDFDRFEPLGDMTHVGEKGISLSGGQRQRISIARALYFKKDITILDDSFSALDAHVGKDVFNKAILGTLAGTTRIIITHALHFLPQVDHIIVMNEGVIIEEGSFQALRQRGAAFAKFLDEFGVKEIATVDDVQQESAVESTDREKSSAVPAVAAMQAEEKNVGSVGATSYIQFFRTAPITFFLPLFVVAAIFFQGGSVMNPYWLVFWQNDELPLSQGVYMGVYAALGLCQALGLFLMGVVFALFTFMSSQRLHRNAMNRVMHAPMSFFHTTPLGRIMNRFSKDIDTVDNVLGEAMRMFLGTVVQVIGSIVLVSIVLPWFLIVVACILLIYYWVALFYRSSARDFKRLDAILRSTLYSHFSESLSGITTIRIYGVTGSFSRENGERIDTENRAYWLTIANQRWLSIRLDFLGACMVFAVAIMAVGTRFSISPAQTGVALSYMLVVQQAFGWAVRQSAEVENNMNSVERLLHYTKAIEQEPPYEVPSNQPPSDWPSKGTINLDRVTASYREGLPAILKDVSLEIQGGEHVALIGRTGAGKSTITQSLYRTLNQLSGKIILDGVDISQIGLRDLRSVLSIIPQDPILFSGSIRYNLDPFGEYDDAHLNDCLKRAWLLEELPKFKSMNSSPALSTKDSDDLEDSAPEWGSSTPTLVTGNRLHLDSHVDEGGSNLSIGQRSLVSLARALAKNSKILILDEATASVDYETDRRIQASLMASSRSKTLLCIAHRLRTIIGYDKIVVLDGGRIVENGEPQWLFSQNGVFTTMCQRSDIDLAEIRTAREKRRGEKIEED